MNRPRRRKGRCTQWAGIPNTLPDTFNLRCAVELVVFVRAFQNVVLGYHKARQDRLRPVLWGKGRECQTNVVPVDHLMCKMAQEVVV